LKILHVKDLYHDIDEVIRSIDEKDRQIKQLHQSIQQFISRDNKFTSEDGDAISNYYADYHIPFLTYIEQFLSDFKHRLPKSNKQLLPLNHTKMELFMKIFYNRKCNLYYKGFTK
jgi:predicted ribonuclease toxin of YeeF-YezG toxin-antitoxin module